MVKVLFSTPEKVSEFARICEDFEPPIDVQKGRYIVDGKSFLGVLSFGCGSELEVKMLSDNAELINDFEEHIKKFSV